MTEAQSEWARCRPWIEAALAVNPFYSIEWVEEQIASGEMTFWAGPHAAAVTEFINYPNGKALNMFAVGGESNQAMDELLRTFEPSLATWAKLAGCKWMIGFAREGWAPSAKALGYRRLWTSFVKELA